MQGSRKKDFEMADKAARSTEADRKREGYTWHHMKDFNKGTGTTTMQLVRTCEHRAKGHSGSVNQYEQAFDVAYDTAASTNKSREKRWYGKPAKGMRG